MATGHCQARRATSMNRHRRRMYRVIIQIGASQFEGLAFRGSLGGLSGGGGGGWVGLRGWPDCFIITLKWIEDSSEWKWIQLARNKPSQGGIGSS